MPVKSITKDHIKTTFFMVADLSEYEKLILEYAVNAYSFLLPRGSFSYSDLANAIENTYSLENPQNAEVVRVLRSINKE